MLQGHFESAARIKGKPSRVEIVAALPDKSEYLQVKEKHFTKSIEALVNDAYDEASELQGEMQEAFDNTPESLQESEVGQAREEAASQLERIEDDVPSVPDSIQSLKIVHYPPSKIKSRADRAGAAADVLRAAVTAAQQHIKEAPKLKKSEVKEIESFCNQLEEHADELEGVEFPGMFG